MALSDNILLAAGNNVDSATIVEPSLFSSSFPGSNMMSDQMWTFAQFATSTAGTHYFELKFEKPVTTRLVAMLKHNAHHLAEWRIRFADTQGNLTVAPLYDSGYVPMTTTTAGMGTLDWGAFDWGDLFPEELISDYNHNTYHALPDDVNALYMRIDIDNTAAYSKDTTAVVKFARMWASPAYQPTVNVGYGAEVIPIDETGFKKAQSGVRHYDTLKVKRRAVRVTFEMLPRQELMRNIFGPFMALGGRSEEVIAMLQPTKPETLVFEVVYGTLGDLNSASHVYWEQMGTTLNIEEQV